MAAPVPLFSLSLRHRLGASSLPRRGSRGWDEGRKGCPCIGKR